MKETINTQIRLPKELHEKLREIAYKKHISINNIMITAIQEFVNADNLQISIKSK